MITALHAENFKSLQDLHLDEFRRINLSYTGQFASGEAASGFLLGNLSFEAMPQGASAVSEPNFPSTVFSIPISTF